MGGQLQPADVGLAGRLGPRKQCCVSGEQCRRLRNSPEDPLQSPCRAARCHLVLLNRMTTPMSTGCAGVQPQELLALLHKINPSFLAYITSRCTFFPRNILAMSHEISPVDREMLPVLGHSPHSQVTLWTGWGRHVSRTHFCCEGGIMWIIAFNCPFRGLPQGD